jgi:hypothetical protein
MLFELRQDGCGVALLGPPKCSSFSACWACRRSSRPPTPPAAAAESPAAWSAPSGAATPIEQQAQRIGPNLVRARDSEDTPPTHHHGPPPTDHPIKDHQTGALTGVSATRRKDTGCVTLGERIHVSP